MSHTPEWLGCEIVAAQALPRGTGATIRAPLVRTSSDVMFMVRDPDAARPIPHRYWSDRDLADLLRSGTFVPLDPVRCARGHRLWVATEDFAALANRFTGAQLVRHDNRPWSWYLPAPRSARWRTDATRALLGLAARAEPCTALRLAGYSIDVAARDSDMYREAVAAHGILRGRLP